MYIYIIIYSRNYNPLLGHVLAIFASGSCILIIILGVIIISEVIDGLSLSSNHHRKWVYQANDHLICI